MSIFDGATLMVERKDNEPLFYHRRGDAWQIEEHLQGWTDPALICNVCGEITFTVHRIRVVDNEIVVNVCCGTCGARHSVGFPVTP